LRHNRKLEKALALIITCTRRVKRPKDIVTLSESIAYAERAMGDLEAVAKAIRLSVQQLKDFQTVEKLCADVKTLVEKRVIDSVDVVKNISKLPAKKQRVLAEHFADGKVTSKDVRIIMTFAQKFPSKSMTKVITDYQKSKDIRVYVAQFRLPLRFNNRVGLRRRFEEIVGKSEIKSLEFQEGIAVLELTDKGHNKLREAVRERKTTLRKFVPSVVEEITRRK